jgi:CHAD domain-containing protein
MKARRVPGLDPQGSLADNAARIVRTRLDELRELAPPALHAERADDQHDLRIAAKRLRYVLELTGFCFGDDADAARRRARELQDVLGDLHDCDVMLPRVRRHAESLRDGDGGAPRRTADRGLEALAAHVQARRALLFERFVALWGELEERRTWERLERALEHAA